MRIIHTADWHLGKMFYGEYLTAVQRRILEEQFIPLVESYRPHAVVLAGDVYDRSLPPVEAVEVFSRIATILAKDMGIPFLVIAGNHDSGQRLSFAGELLEREGLYIAGEPSEMEKPVTLYDEAGPVDFLLMPYADPAKVRTAFADTAVCDHESALIRLRDERCKHLAPRRRTVAVAHAFLAGGTGSDSERPLAVGGSEAVGADVFSSFTYTALGHLHGPQQAGSPVVRYSGSLMKYSFGEAGQDKGVVLVDMDGDGTVRTTFRPLEAKRDVRIIKGYFADIMAAEDGRTDDYVLLRLEDREPILDVMGRGRKKYPHLAALEMPNRQVTETDGRRNGNFRKYSDDELFSSFAAAMRPDIPLSDEECRLASTIWDSIHKEEGDTP